MGIKLTLYNDLVARINDKIPEFLTVRKWNNQVQNEGKEHAFEYPACFIGFSEILWDGGLPRTINTKQLQQAQAGQITITFYCVFEDKQDETPAFEDYEPIIQKIWYYLQGYKTTGNWGGLQRVSEREDNNHDNVIVWEIDFRCAAQDFAACDLTMTDAAPVDLIVTPEVSITSTTETNLRTSDDFGN